MCDRCDRVCALDWMHKLGAMTSGGGGGQWLPGSKSLPGRHFSPFIADVRRSVRPRSCFGKALRHI